jgi:hypothetical protein
MLPLSSMHSGRSSLLATRRRGASLASAVADARPAPCAGAKSWTHGCRPGRRSESGGDPGPIDPRTGARGTWVPALAPPALSRDDGGEMRPKIFFTGRLTARVAEIIFLIAPPHRRGASRSSRRGGGVRWPREGARRTPAPRQAQVAGSRRRARVVTGHCGGGGGADATFARPRSDVRSGGYKLRGHRGSRGASLINTARGTPAAFGGPW